jgi:hypothetical protein
LFLALQCWNKNEKQECKFLFSACTVLLYIVVLGIYLARDILATNERELGPAFDRIYAECLTDYIGGG